MRSQGCTIQQALTPEATTIVKQAVVLAKRRGHAQVTPLHVAHTMLTVSSGLLRAACLQAHAHPLQCRALELCFNVALNRLPTSTSGPMLGPRSGQAHHPTIANALVAAFKRAQAHQRRGSIENQQQPLLSVKVELDQLIISILDDPSVSRVMREAGFSSTLVKDKVEQAISVDSLSQNHSPNNNNNNTNSCTTPSHHPLTDETVLYKTYCNNNSMKFKNCNNNEGNNSSINNVLSMGEPGLMKMIMGKPRLLLSNHDQGGVRNEDVVKVIGSLVMNKRKRNNVLVGECLTSLESIVKEVMIRVEKGDVPEVLKEVRFVQLSFSSFGHLSREEVEQRIGEIKSLVKSCCLDNEGSSSKGLILYFDDLKWANEFRASSNNILVDQHQPITRNYYCPIEHMIMEIGKLVLSFVECGKLWLLGIATFQTYMRCQSGHPSLETLWCLHAITIPVDSLALSLISDSDIQSQLTNKKSEVNGNGWLMLDGGRGGGDGGRIDDMRSHQSPPCSKATTINTTLPSWLQQYKDGNSKRTCSMSNDQDYVPVKDLSKRWSTISTSSSPSFERSPSLSSISPSSSTSNFSYDPLKLQHTHKSFEANNVFINDQTTKSHEPTFTLSIQEHDNNDHPYQRHTNMLISSNPNSTPTSTSSSDINDPIDQANWANNMFKDYNANNLRTLCNALEGKVPWQKDIIFDIASTILHCRCGSSRRKVNNREQGDVKEDTWLFFQGFDVEGKVSIAREIARVIFGTQDKFVSIGLSNFSSKRSDYSLEDSRNKRVRDEHNCIYIERFVEAVSRDSHRVFYIEDIEQVDYCSQMGIKKAIERGKIPNHTSGEEVNFKDAIIILSCERFSSKSRACSPSTKPRVDVLPQEDVHVIMNKGDGKEIITSPNISLDLNISINDEDDNVVKSRSVDEIGLLASVDRCIVFKNHQEL